MSMQSEEQAGYGHYEGRHNYIQQSYEQTKQGPPASLDDNMVEAIAQRMAQLTSASTMQGKIHTARSKPNAGMRLALAIISISILVPLAAITLVAVGGFAGYIAMGGICLFILLINAIFNDSFSS